MPNVPDSVVASVRQKRQDSSQQRTAALLIQAPAVAPLEIDWIGDVGSTFLQRRSGRAIPPPPPTLAWPGPFTMDMCRRGLDVEVDDVQLSEEQAKVLELVLQGESLFITGSAGTGKSVLARAIVRQLRKKYADDDLAVAVTASTGVAARHIGGQTFHSFMGIGLGSGETGRLVRRIQEKHDRRMALLEVRVIIIDEAPMLPALFLQKSSDVLESLRGEDAPFGGVQIVAIGDFHQLPPIPDKDGRRLFAFETTAWKRTIRRHICLRTIHRQRDPEFIALLNDLREGTLSERSLERLQCLQREVRYPDGLEPSELYCTKAEVRRANDKRLDALYGPYFTYDAIDDTDVPGVNLSTTNALVELRLKIGCLVMLVRNRHDDTGLVNGSRGKVLGFCTRGQWDSKGRQILEEEPFDVWGNTALQGVPLDDENINLPIVQFIGGVGEEPTCILVGPESFRLEIEVDEWAERYQIPLIPAYALTTNRCQGMTLDRVRAVLSSSFDWGQKYVLLSRARWAEGLQVIGMDLSLLGPHPAVRDLSASFEYVQ